ncbi:MAG: Membrane fusion protein multidrug efflux system [Lacunisphaera sp.]|nr:Membrane fusion protein multidrug efflux system [Lacunisphaera sp.]MDB6165432.1 Membrane fusion protein multidrug efflux system [Lacunisphaera sp.]
MHVRPVSRFFFYPCLALWALAAGCSRSADPKAAAAPPAVPVQVAVAVQQDTPRRIESIGAVQAQRSVALKSQVDGIIAEIHFREGDDVAAGDLLITLDRRPFENSLRIARADLVNAQAEATRAQADADRYTRLDQQDAISKEQFALLTTKAETTRALAQAKEAAVANAELQLGYAQIRAPIAGRTGQLLLHEGALVKANDNTFTLVTINQLAPIAVAYSVPERSLDEIRAAFAAGTATVTVTDRTSGIQRENGKLEFIDNTVDPATGMITLKAVFPNEDKALWPGRFVYTVTQVGIDVGAIVVPSTAVQNSQNGSTIYVLKSDHTVELRPVKVLRTAGDNTLLADGLKAHETVITDGQIRLLPGMRAEPRAPTGAALEAAAK